MTYFHRLKDWFQDGKYLYAFLVILAILFCLIKLGVGNSGIRVNGLLFQIIGIFPLFLSLKEKSLLFGQVTLLGSIGKYFARFPKKSKEQIVYISGASHSATSLSGTLKSRTHPSENIKEVIEHFEKEIIELEKLISKLSQETSQRINDLSEKIHSLNLTLSQSIDDTNKKLMLVNVSSASRDYFGLFTLAYGIILSTIPEIVVNILTK